ncbi:hypothetical protein Mgra_00007533 [Meloidogyne graminicola]|uniref:C2H2-type domain-containing protein n=1 Tax=Meloidogyne graminicola TaxID=189291 RepID=A0A8S9ZI62_9BILA|nr:hypothetical protein Mgra_00007533 [Meloidogyne graminicola]
MNLLFILFLSLNVTVVAKPLTLDIINGLIDKNFTLIEKQYTCNLCNTALKVTSKYTLMLHLITENHIGKAKEEGKINDVNFCTKLRDEINEDIEKYIVTLEGKKHYCIACHLTLNAKRQNAKQNILTHIFSRTHIKKFNIFDSKIEKNVEAEKQIQRQFIDEQKWQELIKAAIEDKKESILNYYQEHGKLPDEVSPDSENETDEQINTGHNKREAKFSILSNKEEIISSNYNIQKNKYNCKICDIEIKWLKAAIFVNVKFCNKLLDEVNENFEKYIINHGENRCYCKACDDSITVIDKKDLIRNARHHVISDKHIKNVTKREALNKKIVDCQEGRAVYDDQTRKQVHEHLFDVSPDSNNNEEIEAEEQTDDYVGNPHPDYGHVNQYYIAPQYATEDQLIQQAIQESRRQTRADERVRQLGLNIGQGSGSSVQGHDFQVTQDQQSGSRSRGRGSRRQTQSDPKGKGPTN